MEWFLLSADDFWQCVPKGGGVYRLHCYLGNDLTKVMPTQRVLGTDKEGILYIGKALSFLRRVTDLKKAIAPNYRGQNHVCGRRYKMPLYSSFSKQFPYQRLCVSFKPANNPRSAENHAISEYAKTFGELPPLNRQG